MFACIYVPDFPVEAIVRAEPLLRERPVAILEGKPPLVRVIALNETARAAGMEVGMTKLRAAIFAEEITSLRSAGPQKRKTGHIEVVPPASKPRPQAPAVLRQRSPEQEKSAHAALLDVAHAFTPRVEDTAEDRVLLDLAGLERLYGSPAKMAQELSSRVCSLGLEGCIGVAGNPDTAMHAACGFGGIAVIPAGEEAKRLGVLPLPVLLECFDLPQRKESNPAFRRERENLRAQMLDTLERWGVRDFRTLALLPEHALASRLGEAGARLQRLARGAEMRTLALCEPMTHFEEALELESAVETIEPLSFVLNRLLEQLCARLESRALAAQELQIRLQLEPRVADEATTTMQELAPATNSDNVRLPVFFERTLRLPVAMRDAKVFLKLLQLELSAHPPGAPVLKLWVVAQPAPPRSAQRGLFLPLAPEAEKLEITLARIAGIVGERRAGIARLLDTHRKDAFCMERFTATQEKTAAEGTLTMSDAAQNVQLTLRIFRPPHQLHVRTMHGRPASISPASRQTDQTELQGKILWSAGPWRSSGEWWAEAAQQGNETSAGGPWDHEEWDIALANGNGGGIGLYRIYRDTGSGHWFADASYD